MKRRLAMLAAAVLPPVGAVALPAAPRVLSEPRPSWPVRGG
jgi:hypothetical protein